MSGDRRLSILLGVAGFTLATLYVPWFFSAADVPRWAALAVVLSIAFATLDPRPWTAARFIGAVFVAWMAMTVLWAHSAHDAIGGVAKMLMVAAAFEIGARLKSVTPIAVGVAAGLFLSAVTSVWAGHGLFDNPNHMGEAAALTIAAVPVMVILAGPALIISGSKAGFVALAAIVALHLEGKARRLIGIVLLAAIGAIAVTGSGQERIAIWHDALMQLQIFGHGIESVWTALPRDWFSADTQPEHLHNDWLEIAYAGGLPAIALAVGFVLFLPLNGAILAFYIIACFNFPLHEPVTAVLFALYAGHADRGGERLRSVFDRWRMAVHEGRRWFGQRIGAPESGGAPFSFRSSAPGVTGKADAGT